MQHQLESFTGHLRKCLDWGRRMRVVPAGQEIRHVVVSAAGSAGMAAHLVQTLLMDELKIPFTITDSYRIPAFVNGHTLFIALSPSGNTEETLAATEKAIARHAVVACLTGGGKLAQMARERGLALIVPDAATPGPGDFRLDALVGLLFLLHGYGLAGDAFIGQAEKAMALVDDREEVMREGAMDLADALAGRLPILYADRILYPVLLHFRQQINLVARQLVHVNVFPAMNHDELAGWVHPPGLVDQAVMVQVRTAYDHPRVKVRMDICRPVFAPKADKAVEILVRFGDSLLEQCVYLLHLFDWAAFYLARLNGVDPARVEVLDYLEGELAKV